MTLKSLNGNKDPQDIFEWQVKVLTMSDDDLVLMLAINADMKEYEICKIILEELKKREQ